MRQQRQHTDRTKEMCRQSPLAASRFNSMNTLCRINLRSSILVVSAARLSPLSSTSEEETLNEHDRAMKCGFRRPSDRHG